MRALCALSPGVLNLSRRQTQNTNPINQNNPPSLPHDARHVGQATWNKTYLETVYPRHRIQKGAHEKKLAFVNTRVHTCVVHVPWDIRTRCRLPPLGDRATTLTSRRPLSEACPAGGGADAVVLVSRRTWRGTSGRISSIASPSLPV